MFVRSPGPEAIPCLSVKFMGTTTEGNFAEIFPSFTQSTAPLQDEQKIYPSIVGLTHALDHVLLGGPRRLMTASPIMTGLWPAMTEEMWKLWCEYTASNPDVECSVVALEYHTSKRLRPELSCFHVEGVHHHVVLSAMHDDPANDSAAANWLREATSLIRRHQVQHGGKDIGLAANGTSLDVPPEDVWGRSYQRMRIVKAKYDPRCVFNKFHVIKPHMAAHRKEEHGHHL